MNRPIHERFASLRQRIEHLEAPAKRLEQFQVLAKQAKGLDLLIYRFKSLKREIDQIDFGVHAGTASIEQNLSKTERDLLAFEIELDKHQAMLQIGSSEQDSQSDPIQTIYSLVCKQDKKIEEIGMLAYEVIGARADMLAIKANQSRCLDHSGQPTATKEEIAALQQEIAELKFAQQGQNWHIMRIHNIMLQILQLLQTNGNGA